MINYDYYEGLIAKSLSPDDLRIYISNLIEITENAINEYVIEIDYPIDNVPNHVIQDLNMRLGMEGISSPLTKFNYAQELWDAVFPDQKISKAAKTALAAIIEAKGTDIPSEKDVTKLVANLSPLLSIIDTETHSAILLSLYCNIEAREKMPNGRFGIIARSLGQSEGERVQPVSVWLVTKSLPAGLPFATNSELAKYFESSTHVHGSEIAAGSIREGEYLNSAEKNDRLKVVRITDAGCVLSLRYGMWQCLGDVNQLEIEKYVKPEPREASPRQLAPSELPGFVPPVNEFEDLWAEAMLDDFDIKSTYDFEKAALSYLGLQFASAAWICRLLPQARVKFVNFVEYCADLRIELPNELLNNQSLLFGIEISLVDHGAIIVFGPGGHNLVLSAKSQFKLQKPSTGLEGTAFTEALMTVKQIGKKLDSQELINSLKKHDFGFQHNFREASHKSNELKRVSVFLNAWTSCLPNNARFSDLNPIQEIKDGYVIINLTLGGETSDTSIVINTLHPKIELNKASGTELQSMQIFLNAISHELSNNIML